VSRIPDGETGIRSRWSSWTAPTYEHAPGLELVDPPPGSYTPWLQVRLVIEPEALVLGRLGFAAAAIDSYAVFAALVEDGVIPGKVRFQVCLPSPVAPMIVLVEEGSRLAVETAHVRRLHAEIAEILDAVPHDRLAIQWDVCQDVGSWEGVYPPYFEDREDGVIRRLAACTAAVPDDVELGFHFCYGDFGHKHFMNPIDLGVVCTMTNRVANASLRKINYVHMPVPIDRIDDAYFRPLETLDLPASTQLYLGLIHHADGLDGARARIAVARRFRSGFGRDRMRIRSPGRRHDRTAARTSHAGCLVASVGRRSTAPCDDSAMSLRFSLLALLSAKPMTGYDVIRQFDASVGYVWHAPHTQLYPELKRLEAEGLLESESIPRGPRGTKRLYRLTEAGFDELRRMSAEVSVPARERDPYRLRAAYFEWAGPDAARTQLRTHIKHFAECRKIWLGLIRALRGRELALLSERLARSPVEDHDAIVAFKAYAYEGLVARADMEIAWAEAGLRLIDELEASGWDAATRAGRAHHESVNRLTTANR
jgi:DNA-binding PadR family transcriptional regulator